MENITAINDNGNSGNISKKEFLLQFISIYRDMPMLWRINSKDYMDKNKRINAIKKMTELLKVSRWSITEEDVKKKLIFYEQLLSVKIIKSKN